MNKGEKAVVTLLKPMLKTIGYKWVASRGYFIRPEPCGFFSLAWGSYPTTDEGGTYVLRPGIGVRHDRIEDIVNQLDLIYGEEGRQYTETVSCPLCYFPLLAGRDYVQKLRFSHLEEDAQRAADALFDLMCHEGKDFFETYSSLMECSKGLNTPIEYKSHRLYNNYEKRVYYGIATASVCEPERVPDLVRGYLEAAPPKMHDRIAQKVAQLLTIIGVTVD